MSIKVCKFGGTSMADAAAIDNVASIVLSDPARKYVVVSAPGKRDKNDVKVTDLLYSCHKEAVETGTCAKTFAKVKERFIGICKDLGLTIDMESVLERTQQEIDQNTETPDFAASRGEYLSGVVMAARLGYAFIDAADIIRFDVSGNLSVDYTNDRASAKLGVVECAVVPGFYGKGANGKVKTFSRGGSDITGSIVARAVKADVYENWTDVSGCLVADPRIVDNPKGIKILSYKELRELSYMGASVLHADAIFPVRRARIPINIRNTFAPNDDGTMIVPSEMYNHDGNSIITGIAGKKNFTVIFIEKSMMNSEIGFARKVLSVMESHGIPMEHMPSGIDTLSVVVDGNLVKGDVLDAVCTEIQELVQPDFMRVMTNISLVATVGHGMARKAGISARLFSALAREQINIQLIDQGSSELNIIVGVADSDYEKCIRAIYREFAE